MTTYIGTTDLNSRLNGFVDRYYGTYIDDGEDLTIEDQFYEDMRLSYQEANAVMSSIPHIKTIPVGTQTDGSFPYHVKMLQANMMIYARLKSRHADQFVDNIPGWINTFNRDADSIIGDLRKQNVAFDEQTTIAESGIGVASFTVKSGAANAYTNWETGFFRGADHTRSYVVEIDGTGNGNVIGSSTFRWSNDGGYSWVGTLGTTGTAWRELEDGVAVRWAAVGTSSLQHEYGDRFIFTCVPSNIPTVSGQVGVKTFRRG